MRWGRPAATEHDRQHNACPAEDLDISLHRETLPTPHCGRTAARIVRSAGANLSHGDGAIDRGFFEGRLRACMAYPRSDVSLRSRRPWLTKGAVAADVQPHLCLRAGGRRRAHTGNQTSDVLHRGIVDERGSPILVRRMELARGR